MALGPKTFLTAVDFATTATFSSLTANKAIYLDASGNLAASTVSNTELGYLFGVTSSIQTQLDGKQAEVITTRGDLVYGDALGDSARLAVGTNGQVLSTNGTDVFWDNVVITDELVKVSANDTTAKYLEDAIVVSSGTNSVNILELSTLNDGVNEDLRIQIDQAKINHDALLNFVANEHIDHSTVSIATAAGSGMTGGGDITTTRNLSVDITGTTAETSIASGDELLIYDTSATALKKMTRANFVSGLATASSGDLSETSFAMAQSAAGASVTGFAFANATVRSFEAQVSVFIDATSDLYAVFSLRGVQRGTDWVMNVDSAGDSTSITFDISTTGQVTYSSSTYTGFASGTMKFRAITTSV